MPSIIYREECYAVVVACIEVYREKGAGFLEAVYQECLEMELSRLEIPFAVHPLMEVHYKGKVLKQCYQPDFICWNEIIIEIKAAATLTDQHRAQVHNYLKASGYKLGILVNFGHYPKLEWERIVNERAKDSNREICEIR